MSVIGAVFAGVIALVGTMALKTLKAARASRSWPVAAGTVLSGDIREVTERDSDGGVTTYSIPRLRYAYEVAGRRFESARIRFGDVRESEKRARKILPKDPIDKHLADFPFPLKRELRSYPYVAFFFGDRI